MLDLLGRVFRSWRIRVRFNRAEQLRRNTCTHMGNVCVPGKSYTNFGLSFVLKRRKNLWPWHEYSVGSFKSAFANVGPVEYLSRTVRGPSSAAPNFLLDRHRPRPPAHSPAPPLSTLGVVMVTVKQRSKASGKFAHKATRPKTVDGADPHIRARDKTAKNSGANERQKDCERLWFFTWRKGGQFFRYMNIYTQIYWIPRPSTTHKMYLNLITKLNTLLYKMFWDKIHRRVSFQSFRSFSYPHACKIYFFAFNALHFWKNKNPIVASRFTVTTLSRNIYDPEYVDETVFTRRSTKTRVNRRKTRKFLMSRWQIYRAGKTAKTVISVGRLARFYKK